MDLQGWRARASERHLQAWGEAFGYSVRAERAAGKVRFHMAPVAA